MNKKFLISLSLALSLCGCQKDGSQTSAQDAKENSIAQNLKAIQDIILSAEANIAKLRSGKLSEEEYKNAKIKLDDLETREKDIEKIVRNQLENYIKETYPAKKLDSNQNFEKIYSEFNVLKQKLKGGFGSYEGCARPGGILHSVMAKKLALAKDYESKIDAYIKEETKNCGDVNTMQALQDLAIKKISDEIKKVGSEVNATLKELSSKEIPDIIAKVSDIKKKSNSEGIFFGSRKCQDADYIFRNLDFRLDNEKITAKQYIDKEILECTNGEVVESAQKILTDKIANEIENAKKSCQNEQELWNMKFNKPRIFDYKFYEDKNATSDLKNAIKNDICLVQVYEKTINPAFKLITDKFEKLGFFKKEQAIKDACDEIKKLKKGGDFKAWQDYLAKSKITKDMIDNVKSDEFVIKCYIFDIEGWDFRPQSKIEEIQREKTEDIAKKIVSYIF